MSTHKTTFFFSEYSAGGGDVGVCVCVWEGGGGSKLMYPSSW